MKKLTGKIIMSITLIAVTLISKGQTTVSGGIYANTTWTLANSPYTADSVVVFPNVTLTIEPGVVIVVNGDLEIRQSSLIAEGTPNDSITFIGSLPILGDTLSDITINFHDALTSRLNYCNIKENPDRGIEVRLGFQDTLTIKNSTISENGTGIFYINIGTVFIDSCIFKNNGNATQQTYGSISNCVFRNNDNGLMSTETAQIQNCIIDSNGVVGIALAEGGTGSLLTNCEIKNNGIGLLCTSNSGSSIQNLIHHNVIENNDYGVQISSYDSPDSIYCNKICNNNIYNLRITTSRDRIVANNYWCSTDSLAIANSIYDGYDNATFGLIDFMPIDTVQCYLVTGMNASDYNDFSYSVFPNPANDFLFVQLPSDINSAELKIYNLLGEIKLQMNIGDDKTRINIANFNDGIYLIEVSNGKYIVRKSFIKQQNVF